MPNSTVGGALAAAEPKAVPQVGETFILQFAPNGGMHEVYGDQYYKNGTYVEVEVKAVKTAKVVLE